jgi:16S rRNA (adenine1518-N6/adenine1519-N6)-dimethyltransferase
MVDKISSLLVFLNQLQAFPSKRLSQNFLIDKNIIKKIVAKAEVKEDDIVLEIGPGPGALTREIIKRCKNVIAVEKDKKFADYLSKNEKNLTLFEGDFLQFPLREFFSKKNCKAKVIANLPYHIASPIIAKLLENYDLFSEITIMVQYEMAKRLISTKDCKNYSAFTIFINFYAEPKLLFEISPNCFFPRPKVRSAIIQLKIKKPLSDIDREKFHLFVQKTFQQRRKKLTTSLKNILTPDLRESLNFESILKELQIDPNARPENLSLEEFYLLFKKFF